MEGEFVMANAELHTARRIYPAHGDPVRIVPLHVPDAVRAPTAEAATAAAAPPQLTYRNGPLIVAPEVFTIFWGSAWQQGAPSALAARLNQFFDDILAGPLIDQLAEYSVPGQEISHGKRTGTTTIAEPAPRPSVSDTAIQHLLQQEIATSEALPHPTPRSLYFIYLAPGTRVVQGGGASCQAFCGYHNDISGQIFYAVMPYPGCGGCTGGLPVFDALTTTSSHELCEAITDPIPGRGWYDDVNGEIGDICAWKTKTIGPYTVQLEWSNKAGQCM
jgi:hypothetical protein